MGQKPPRMTVGQALEKLPEAAPLLSGQDKSLPLDLISLTPRYEPGRTMDPLGAVTVIINYLRGL